MGTGWKRGKSIPARAFQTGMALLGLLYLLWEPPFCPPQGKGRGLGHSRVPAVPPSLPAVPVGCTWLVGQQGWGAPWPGQQLHGSEVSCGISAPSRFRTGWKHLAAPLSPSVPLSCQQLCSSTGMCYGEIRPALSQPPPPPTLLFSTPSILLPLPEQHCLSQGTGCNP